MKYFTLRKITTHSITWQIVWNHESMFKGRKVINPHFGHTPLLSAQMSPSPNVDHAPMSPVFKCRKVTTPNTAHVQYLTLEHGDLLELKH